MEKTVAFKKNARNVFFHILTTCNFRCRHCYINPNQHGKQTLPLNVIEKWLLSLCDPAKETNLIFIGGEPTLHPELATMIRKAWQIGYASVTVDTNGTFCKNILDKVAPEEVNYFSVGLDGSNRRINDAIRGDGSFEKTMGGIKKALKKGFNLSLIYTVNSDNISDLKNMPPFLKAIGVWRFFIQVVGIRGRSAQAGGKGLQVSRKQWANVVPRVARSAAKMGIHVTYPKVFLTRSETFACAGMVADNRFVFPNGRVYQCPLCEDFPLHSFAFEKDTLMDRPPINERQLFQLSIPEGCVMNKLIQPGNLGYDGRGRPRYKIACCLLKEEVLPESR